MPETGARREQSVGLSQISVAVSKMDSYTQKNAGVVEGTANATAQPRDKAQHLAGFVNTFTLVSHASGATRKAPLQLIETH
jgi:methyl-accepting chemotaxis protein